MVHHHFKRDQASQLSKNKVAPHFHMRGRDQSISLPWQISWVSLIKHAALYSLSQGKIVKCHSQHHRRSVPNSPKSNSNLQLIKSSKKSNNSWRREIVFFPRAGDMESWELMMLTQPSLKSSTKQLVIRRIKSILTRTTLTREEQDVSW